MTQDEIIQLIQKFYAENGKAPAKRNFESIVETTARRIFGSWNAAIVASDIPVNRKLEHTEAELIESLHRYAAENGRSPGAADCNKCSYLYDTRTYTRKLECKTWSQVLRKAGLEEYYEISPFTQLSDDDLLLLIKSIITAENADATADYYKRNKGALPSLETLVTRFGSWGAILERLGINQNMNRYTQAELLEIFYEAKSHFGRVPSVWEFDAYAKISSDLYKRYWGTWRKFLKSIGEKPVTADFAHVTETNEELIEIYKDFSQRNGYTNGATASSLKNSDKMHSADVYIYRFGTLNKLREICGYEPIIRRQY